MELIRKLFLVIYPCVLILGMDAWGQTETYRQAKESYQKGRYFQAAQQFFVAGKEMSALEGRSDADITISLIHSKLYNSASYFFLKTLKQGSPQDKRRVVAHTAEIIERLGFDLIVDDLLEHTLLDYYQGANRDHFAYALGKDLFFKGSHAGASKLFRMVRSSSYLYPFAQFSLGATELQLNRTNQALLAFQECLKKVGSSQGGDAKVTAEEVSDLKNRCQSGIGKAHFQARSLNTSLEAYGDLEKKSWAWTNSLFEQAWVGYWGQDYNMALGKLVSYKSPILSFVLKPEIFVLRSMSYMKLCLWEDALKELQRFRLEYIKNGREVRRELKEHFTNLQYFWVKGKKASQKKIDTLDFSERLILPIIKSAKFRNLVAAEAGLEREYDAVRAFGDPRHPLTQFLREVLKWRSEKIAEDGGEMVLAQAYDFYRRLVTTANQMSYVRLEILSKFKEKIRKPLASNLERLRGAPFPNVSLDQYFWTFNGEFWGDELGDYVFALQSSCLAGGN